MHALILHISTLTYKQILQLHDHGSMYMHRQIDVLYICMDWDQMSDIINVPLCVNFL